MKIEYNDYNVAKVDFGTVTASTKTKIGTAKEFEKFAKLVNRSALAVVRFKISTTEYVAALNAVVDTGDVVLSGVINASGAPAFVTAVAEEDDGDAYVTLAVTAMPEVSASKSK